VLQNPVQELGFVPPPPELFTTLDPKAKAAFPQDDIE
jgi:hypothetical protein